MKDIMKENIRDRRKNTRIVTELMLKLLPVQILIAAVTAVNGIVSSFFASNFIGVDAMGAVGLYGPINMLLAASAMLLSGGSAILCGKYLGRNEHDKMQNVFSLDLVLALIIGAVFSLLFLLLGLFAGQSAARLSRHRE